MSQLKYKFDKVKSYIEHYGVQKLAKKVVEKVDRSFSGTKSCEAKVNKGINDNYEFDYRPLISIIVPAFNTKPKALVESMSAVIEQTYENWELCVSDGGDEKVKNVLDALFAGDSRLKYVDLPQNLGIAENTNKALELATGDYIALLDHDDILEPDTLLEVVKRINEEGAEFIYTDEDKVSENLEKYFRAFHKPDFNLTLLLSNNYICHFCTVKTEIARKVGGFDSMYDGAQDYDFILKCIEQTDKISHIPQVLYHWRVGNNSTATNPFNKEYAFDAGKLAIEAYYQRNGLSEYTEVTSLDDPGYFKTICRTKDKTCAVAVYPGKFASAKELLEGIPTDCTHLLLLKEDMEISEGWEQILTGKMEIFKAGISIPKAVVNKKYLYNGIASTGNGMTASLKGKPEWYHGDFNLAMTDMEVNYAPKYGILIKKELIYKYYELSATRIDNRAGIFAGIKMIYVPEVTVNRVCQVFHENLTCSVSASPKAKYNALMFNRGRDKE